MSSGSLRVRVYAGIDVLTKRRLYLTEVVPVGPDAAARAERVRQELVDLVAEGRQPRTNATLGQLLESYLASSPVGERERETRAGYVRRHVAPLVGDRPVSLVTVEVLEGFYAELRRCRDHCGLRLPGVPSPRVGHRCRPLAAGTVRHIHYVISGAFESAIRWGWLSVNPARQALSRLHPRRIRSPRRPTRPRRCWVRRGAAGSVRSYGWP